MKFKQNKASQITQVIFRQIHYRNRYHIETSLPSPICSANQWTGFYMITASVMKELISFYFSVWEKAGLTIHPTMIHDLVNDVTHPLEDVRLAVSLALGVSLEENKSIDVVPKLLEIYNEKLKVSLVYFYLTYSLQCLISILTS